MFDHAKLRIQGFGPPEVPGGPRVFLSHKNHKLSPLDDISADLLVGGSVTLLSARLLLALMMLGSWRHYGLGVGEVMRTDIKEKLTSHIRDRRDTALTTIC